jgi:hypothetical protein
MTGRAVIERRFNDLLGQLRSFAAGAEGLAVVKAPPGSGKTYLLMEIVEYAVGLGLRVAVATQTNSQADDVCRRLAEDHAGVVAYRFAAKGAIPKDLGASVRWISDKGLLPTRPSVSVATTAKWSLTDLAAPFDILFVDEAWQMAWADFMLLGRVSGRFCADRRSRPDPADGDDRG